jgi:hypothetical protein
MADPALPETVCLSLAQNRVHSERRDPPSATRGRLSIDGQVGGPRKVQDINSASAILGIRHQLFQQFIKLRA